MVASDEGWTGDTTPLRQLTLIERYRSGSLGDLKVIDHGTNAGFERTMMRAGIIPSLWIAAGVALGLLVWQGVWIALMAVAIPLTVIVAAAWLTGSKFRELRLKTQELSEDLMTVELTVEELVMLDTSATAPSISGTLHLIDSNRVPECFANGIGWRAAFVTFRDDHERVLFVLNRGQP